MIMLCGYALICLVLRPGQRHWLELLGLSFAGGSAVVSMLLFAVSLCGAPPSRMILTGIAGLAAILLYLTRRQHGLVSPSVPSPRHKLDAMSVLGFISAGLLLLALFRASTKADAPVLNEVDSIAIWLLKAKWVALKPLLPIPPEFLNPTLSYSHQDYPLGFPLLAAGLFAMVGRFDDRLIHFILVPIALALAATMYTAVRRLHRRALAVILTAVFIAAPSMTQDLGSPVAESLLILMYTAALTMLLQWMETRERGDLLLAGLLAAGTACVKNEGLALLPVFGFVALLWSFIQRPQTPILIHDPDDGGFSSFSGRSVEALFRRNKGAPAGRLLTEDDQTTSWAPIKTGFSASVISVLTLTPWLIYRIYLPRTHEDYGGKMLNPQMIAHNLSRLFYILPHFFGSMFDAGRVGLLWYLLAIVVVLCPGAFKRGPVLLLWFMLLAQLSLYLMTFVVTPWEIQALLPLISPRLLTQASPLAAILIAVHLRELNWPAARPATTKSSIL
jgi:hypothetical protein